VFLGNKKMLEQIDTLAPDRQPFNIVTLTNRKGMQISVMDWGATWLSCKIPLLDGTQQEVLLGCDSPLQYLKQKAYLGATIGRYANRIKNAEINHKIHCYQLVANEGVNQLHGGAKGFSERRWNLVSHDDRQVVFAIYSPDGDQGYPGNMKATVSYSLTEQDEVEIAYFASVDDACPINLTNHAYFNLELGGRDARHQKLMINGDYFLPVNAEGIPVVGLKSVLSSPGMDFLAAKTILKDFLRDKEQRIVGGYDHAYLLHADCADMKKPAAQLISSDGRRRLSVFTTKPAIQFYSGNGLAGTPARDGGTYRNYAGIALETQFLPDSPNHPEWPQPDCWIAADQDYRAKTVYQFTSF
jgi:aldose 1-epimerase